ncbi:glycoside hydrolase family 10 protein [Nocardiopsis sp. MG754419]|uniref:glycoside hydrolase family 10 protein n=1 Tax=Nocardiopsis sp. MG754419 TaxID=2259865 RepID=UPI001BAA02A7|nr:family 10 glycosylhydrolase [Nocardiopsis sp. MG754419]MBR8741186.1 glycosyl hydrolase [Nocardiopsis sp. MG754419]
MAYSHRNRPRARTGPSTVPIPHPAARGTLFAGALATALTAALLYAPQAAATPVTDERNTCETDPEAPPKRQMRAEWIAGVENIDWPSEQGLSAQEQQSELAELYDGAVDNGLNAVFVQIRPTADAFWPSPHEPWSEWLTGEQGGDPGYDPLEYAVEEAHARNLEFHAWYNPYRIAMHDDPSRLVEAHPARQNPDWVFDYDGKLYYDPGIPEAREFVIEAMMHSVENYDLDGVHFDDYFYPYPVEGVELPDADTFAEHGGEFDDIEDWRRDNVDTMVREMSEAVDAAKPHVKFGISPFGIWRNSSTDPEGSDTSGFESYDGQYADSRTWVTEGWLDYINPQIYWEIGLPVADYAVLVPWWEEVAAGTDTHLYIGQAAYKVGNAGAWEDPNELSSHLDFNRDHPGVHGDVYFSATSLRTNAEEATEILVADHYSSPALIPVKDDLGGAAPEAPEADVSGDGTLEIAPGADEAPAYYAVYAFDGEPDPDEARCGIEDPRTMLGTVRADEYGAATFDVSEGSDTTYYVTALDRLHHESPASAPVRLP